MIVQISSGQGPAECELAVKKLYDTLKQEYGDLVIISSHAGKEADCYSSILFETEHDLSELEGSVQWICTSPFRPNHKRKNWYVDISMIPEQEVIPTTPDIKFERFHCGGKGGQNVNKVETGVRLTHIPTGIVVTSTQERSQILNRKIALEKLNQQLADKKKTQQKTQVHNAWREHTKIVRGNPVRVYRGIRFERV
jgi:peptide chain release factor